MCTEKDTYWKSLCLNLLFAFQALFLASTTWDFFLTVIVANSHRALIFSQLGIFTTGIIVIPWLVLIFVLSAMLLVFLYKKDKNQPELATGVHYGYFILSLLYLIFFFLGIFNPVVAWPIVLNYIVNFVWSIVLIFFRIRVKDSL